MIDNRTTTYCLGLMIEEMAEAQQLMGKALRFGLDAPGCDVEPYNGKTARQNLPKELGDVLASIAFACYQGLFDEDLILDQADAKLLKLTDPESKDANGHRLAPPLPEEL